MRGFTISRIGPFEYQTFVDLDLREMVTTVTRDGQNLRFYHRSSIPVHAFVFDEFYARHMAQVLSGDINEEDGA